MKTFNSIITGLFILSLLFSCEATESTFNVNPNSVPDQNIKTGIIGQVYSIGTPGPIPDDWTPPLLEAKSTIVVLDINRNLVKEFSTDEKGKFQTSLNLGVYFIKVKESRIPKETGPYILKEEEVIIVEAYYDNGMR